MDVLSPSPCGVILQPRDLSLPLETGPGRVELEIGFGNGEYAVQYARAHPEVMLFGLEVDFGCMLRCARRAAGLRNLKILRADARFMMRELFRDGSLDRVVMNFPCPWPKRRHAGRRVTARDFADGLAAVLKAGGVFELTTDDGDYATEARAGLGAHPALEVRAQPARPVATKYGRRWLAEGKTIFQMTFVRRDVPFTVGRRITGKEEEALMIDATAEGIASLSGISGRDGEASWAFRRGYEGGGIFLLETFSDDGGFQQRYYIRVSGRSVQLDHTANAFLTPAVRGSLRDAAERLSR